MSTKSSLAWTEEFHLYTDFLEPGRVFLRLGGAPKQFRIADQGETSWQFRRQTRRSASGSK